MATPVSSSADVRSGRQNRPLSDHRLLRHLVLAVIVKLALLAGLWWFFVRDARVVVDAQAAAERVQAPAAAGAAGAQP